MISMQHDATIWTLSGALLLGAWGCGDDSSDSDDGAAAGKNGATAGTAGTGGRGDGKAGAEAASGSGGEGETQPAEGIYVVGGYQTTVDDWVGYLAVVSDISAQGSVDLTRVVEFPDDMSYASPGDGRVYVGNGGAPVIERWVLDGDSLTLDQSMGLSQFGIQSGLGMKDPLHFLARDRAYFIDGDSLQVVVWNPETMETESAFSIEGLLEQGMFHGLNYVHRDGDRLLLSARYWRSDDSAAPLTRIAIIDTTTDTVTYVDDTRCGNIAFHAHDAANNLYLASHPAQTGAIAVGAAGDPVAESCIIRFNSGADEFDPEYYVGLDDLTGGHAGGIIQGAGNEAFVMKYAGAELTLDNYARAHTGSNWEIHRITLGAEEESFEKVEGVGLQSAYGLAFTTTVAGKAAPFVIAVEGDFSEGAYYDVSAPGRFERALTVPGFPGKAILVR